MVASGNESYNVNYNYNSCNQLTDSVEVRGGVTTSTIYTYDKNGNEIACKKTGGVVSNKTMVYNGLNKLVTATVDGTTTNYSYRPDGLRHNKVNGANTTIHLWSGQNIVAELSGTGAVKGRYFRGIGLIAQQIDSNTQYYLFNAHGDIVQRTSANGTLLKSYDYDAFGVEKLEEPLDQNPFRYCGEYFDKETQTIYLRARSYNPRTGRFTAQDPARDGLNWYTYCGGNPLMFVDPSGLKSEDRIGSGIWSLKTDTMGILIVSHWLYGGGKDLILTGDYSLDHEVHYTLGQYMMENKILTSKVKSLILPMGNELKNDESISVNMTTSMAIDNGEDIIGYQYLHGTNADVGGFQINGSISKNSKGDINYDLTYTWNDMIDPNFIYESDSKKAEFAKSIPGANPTDYRIQISWSDKTVIKTNLGLFNCSSGWLSRK